MLHEFLTQYLPQFCNSFERKHNSEAGITGGKDNTIHAASASVCPIKCRKNWQIFVKILIKVIAFLHGFRQSIQAIASVLSCDRA